MAILQNKLMLLVDINGTIGIRVEEPIQGIRSLLYIRHKYFYPRFGVVPFLRKWGRDPRFEVCIFSSVHKHNILPILDALDTNWKSYIKKVYDNKYNKEDPNKRNPWDTIRDFTKILADSPQQSMKTILTIDNESRKIQEAPYNGVIIPEFGLKEATNKKGDTLNYLDQYLTKMSSDKDFLSSNWDVREYIKKNPFYDNNTNTPNNNTNNTAAEISQVTETISKLTVVDDKLDFSVYGPVTMRMDVIKQLQITYRGHTLAKTTHNNQNSNIINIKIEGNINMTSVLESKMQLARLLMENKGMKVFIDDKFVPYEPSECENFLKGIPYN
jgi:hypothetical protein